MRFGLLICLFAPIGILSVAGVVGQTRVAAPSSASPAAGNTATVFYKNTQYGFCFILPASWKGYTVIAESWEGAPLDGGAKVSGPQLRIRHPSWTQNNPHEDIPIMVFTPAEWQRVDSDELSVSAAPLGPMELGRNRRYVFALPARYNYDFADGWEEVDRLIRSHALKSPCDR